MLEMLITKCFYFIYIETKEKIEEGEKKMVIPVIVLVLIQTQINNLL